MLLDMDVVLFHVSLSIYILFKYLEELVFFLIKRAG